MKNILILFLFLFSASIYAQTEQDAVNSEVRGHDVSFYAAASCGAFTGSNPYTGQLTSKSNQTGVSSFVLSNAVIGDIMITSSGIYEITATDNAANPTITVQLINNPLLLGFAFAPTGDCAVIRPTSQGLLPSYVADGVNGLSFNIEAFIGNFNANQIDAKLSDVSLTETITQAAHGFSVLDLLGDNNGTYVQGDTSFIVTSGGTAISAMVTEVVDVNTFKLIRTPSVVTVTAHGLSIDSLYYVSDGAQATKDEFDRQIQYVYKPLDANTILWNPWTQVYLTSGSITSGGGDVTKAELASTANGVGASLIGIADAIGAYASGTVEGALAEVKALADGTILVGNGSQIATSVNVSGSNTINNAGVMSNTLNSVDGTHIALGSDVIGDIMYHNGTDYVRLPMGTTGEVLNANTGAAPSWATVAANKQVIPTGVLKENFTSLDAYDYIKANFADTTGYFEYANRSAMIVGPADTIVRVYGRYSAFPNFEIVDANKTMLVGYFEGTGHAEPGGDAVLIRKRANETEFTEVLRWTGLDYVNMTVSEVDGEIIVASRVNPSSTLHFAKSTDGGETFGSQYSVDFSAASGLAYQVAHEAKIKKIGANYFLPVYGSNSVGQTFTTAGVIYSTDNTFATWNYIEMPGQGTPYGLSESNILKLANGTTQFYSRKDSGPNEMVRFSSTDDGLTWTSDGVVATIPRNAAMNVVQLSDGRLVNVCRAIDTTGNLLFESADNGDTWTNSGIMVNIGITFSEYGNIQEADGKVYFVVANDSPTGADIYFGELFYPKKYVITLTKSGSAVIEESGGVNYKLTNSFRESKWVENPDKSVYNTTLGNVGIGLKAPLDKMHITGNLRLYQNAGSNRYLYLNTDGTGTGALSIQAGLGSTGFGGSVTMYSHAHATKPGNVEIGISSGSGGKVLFTDGGAGVGTEIFSVNSSGTAALNNYGTGSKTAANLTKTASSYVPVFATDGTIIEALQTGASSANNGISLLSGVAQLGLTTAGTGSSDFTSSRYLYTGAFDLGIGSAAGNRRFFLQGATGNVGIGTTLGIGARLHITTSGTTNATNSLLVDNSAGTNLLTLRDNGKLGILYANPPEVLSVTGNGFLTGTLGVGTNSLFGAQIMINGNIGVAGTTDDRWIYAPATLNHTGRLTMQMGGGSIAAGGAFSSFGAAHATKPGWVMAGISSGSGTTGAADEGRFTVNAEAIGGGTDLFSVRRSGKVGIGTGAADPLGILELKSTTQAFVLPRMTAAQRNLITGVDGMMIFCTDCTANDTSTGVSQTFSSTSWRNHY